jgi:hypothetical protein
MTNDYDPVLDDVERADQHEQSRLAEAREKLAEGEPGWLLNRIGAERLEEWAYELIPMHVIEDEVAEAEDPVSEPCSAQMAVRHALELLDDVMATEWLTIQDTEKLASAMAVVIGRARVARSRLRRLSAADYVIRRAS